MKMTIVGIGGFIGAAIGLPAILYIVGPALKQVTEEWIRLGTIAKVFTASSYEPMVRRISYQDNA